VAWHVYSDPDFPVDFDNNWPGLFWFLANPDSFPVVRINGDFSPNTWRMGHGVLIVTGELSLEKSRFGTAGWQWKGIILAGSIGTVDEDSNVSIQGVLVGGMGSSMEDWNLDINGSTIQYHSCYVERAGLSLAHLSPIDNSWWEDRGGSG